MTKTALILGGANCVFTDIEKALKLFTPTSIFAINDIGTEYPNVQHWCSMHPEKMPSWLEKRRANNLLDPPFFWTASNKKWNKDLTFKVIPNTKGGSGLLAVYVARHLGFEKIVLAGIPMAREFDHYHTPGAWKECKLYRTVWQHTPNLRERNDIRSFSGWTKEFFGEPTTEWLSGG